jgi:hypothetical protein
VAALLAGLAPVLASAPAAQAACATNTGKSISGTVFGQDGRDVNVSIGFDVVDRNGRALNTDPRSAGYGCAKTGGYSVPQSYLNHFVGPEGAPQGSTMQDGNRTTRAWKLSSLPSNAVGAYIEVYHRGYTGSPCRTRTATTASTSRRSPSTATATSTSCRSARPTCRSACR